MVGRSELEQYPNAAIVLENFNVMPQGGIDKRTGSQYCTTAYGTGSPCRLITFQPTTTNAYVLEFGNGYIRPLLNGQPTGTIITVPYQTADLFTIQAREINDVLLIVHPNYPEATLSTSNPTQWTYAPFVWKYAPITDFNYDTTKTIASSGSSGNVTLTASGFTFSNSQVGSYLGAQYTQTGQNTDLVMDGGTWVTSPSVIVGNTYYVQTTGTWSGSLIIEESYDGGTTWTTVREVAANDDNNYSFNVSVVDSTILNSLHNIVYARMRCNATATVTAGAHGYLWGDTYQFDVQFLITAVASGGGTASATVIYGFPMTSSTYLYSFGPSCPANGYFGAVEIHEQRVCLSGHPAYPQTVWMSQINDFYNFLESTGKDTDAIQVTIASTDRNAVQWMASFNVALVIGTGNSEWIFTGGNSALASSIITPTAIQVRRVSTFGSSPIFGRTVNNQLLFIQRGQRKLREMQFDYLRNTYTSENELTILSYDTTSPGIIQSDYLQLRDSRYIAVTGDGRLITMTYEPSQQIKGWSQWTTQGIIESACVVKTTTLDQVYMSVQRTINGAVTRYIEVVNQQPVNALPNVIFSDCAKVVTNVTPSNTVSGMTYLMGQTVNILADGAPLAQQTVSSDTLTLPSAASTVIIGLPYYATAAPMPFDFNPTRKGMYNRIPFVIVDFYNSLGCYVGQDLNKLRQIKFRPATQPWGTATPLYTGQLKVYLNSFNQRQATVYFQSQDPFPCTILSIVVKYAGVGRDL